MMKIKNISLPDDFDSSLVITLSDDSMISIPYPRDHYIEKEDVKWSDGKTGGWKFWKKIK